MELCHLIGVEVEAQHTIFPFFEREEHGWTARCIFALYIVSVGKKLGNLGCSVLRTGKDAKESPDRDLPSVCAGCVMAERRSAGSLSKLKVCAAEHRRRTDGAQTAHRQRTDNAQTTHRQRTDSAQRLSCVFHRKIKVDHS